MRLWQILATERRQPMFSNSTLTADSVAYFKFETLSTEIKKANKIKPESKEPRLDCTFTYNPIKWKGFDYCITQSGANAARLFWTLRPAAYDSKINILRQADYQIKKSVKQYSYNISSLYIEHEADGLAYGYGYFSNKQEVGKKEKRPNPFYVWQKDLFLFITNPDFSIFEVLIIPDGRLNYRQHLKNLIQDSYKHILEEARMRSNVFYQYQNPDNNER